MNTIKNFSGSTQLLFSSLHGRQAARPLFALPSESGLPELLGNTFSRMHFLYHDYAVYRLDRDTVQSNRLENIELQYAPVWKPAESLHDLACIYLPKGTDLIELAFSSVSATLEPGSHVLIVGPKKSAIRSSKPLIEKYFGEILSSLSGRHCVLIEARKTIEAPAFEAEKEYSIETSGKELQVVTLPGVFSHGKLDEGTGFLLKRLEGVRFERALDWGCGAGVIGAALMLACPDGVVHFTDTNVLAIEATRRTLEANGLTSDCVRPSDIFSDIHDSYDLIVSNPPFHTGLKTDLSTPQRFIREAGKYLDSSGRLIIVANTFINYFRDLRQYFKDVNVLAENKQYRVIDARRALRG